MQTRDKCRQSHSSLWDHTYHSHYTLLCVHTWTTNLSAHRSTMSTWEDSEKKEWQLLSARLRNKSYKELKWVSSGCFSTTTCSEWKFLFSSYWFGILSQYAANIQTKDGAITTFQTDQYIYDDFKTKSWPTSSMGSSSSCGRQGDSTPMRNGVGEQLMSSMLAGSTGTKVCCQVKGYSSASTAWPHRDNTLPWTGEERKRSC